MVSGASMTLSTKSSLYELGHKLFPWYIWTTFAIDLTLQNVIFPIKMRSWLVSWSLDSRTNRVASRGVWSEDLMTTLTVSLNENTQIIVKRTGNLCKYSIYNLSSPSPNTSLSGPNPKPKAVNNLKVWLELGAGADIKITWVIIWTARSSTWGSFTWSRRRLKTNHKF